MITLIAVLSARRFPDSEWSDPNSVSSTVTSLFRLLAFCLATALGITFAAAWQSDNGDGTYTNPVLYADYADPDIIRVGADFYMVSTTFVNSPGINLLRSKDMVNWELVAQIASTVDGGNSFNMVGGTAYEQGYWASSIRATDFQTLNH